MSEIKGRLQKGKQILYKEYNSIPEFTMSVRDSLDYFVNNLESNNDDEKFYNQFYMTQKNNELICGYLKNNFLSSRKKLIENLKISKKDIDKSLRTLIYSGLVKKETIMNKNLYSLNS